MPKLLNGMWSLEKRLLRWQAKDFMEKVTFKSRRCRSLSLWGELLYFILFLFGPRSCQRVQVSKQSIKKVLVEEYQNSQWLQGSFVWACAHAAPGIFLRSVQTRISVSELHYWCLWGPYGDKSNCWLIQLSTMLNVMLLHRFLKAVLSDAFSATFKQLIDVDMECDADRFHNSCSREAFPSARSTSLHKH